MSGVAGGNRIKKQNVEATFREYIDKVLKKIPSFRNATLSGSVKVGAKADYGDLDIITTFELDDKKDAKQEIIKVVSAMPDDVIIPFRSEKYQGKKFYNSGEIISVLYPIVGVPGEFIQIDNMISLSETEHVFKNSFLDLPAEKQGLILGLVKVVLLEEDPAKVFARLGITKLPKLENNQEFDFNLSSVNLTLRKVTLDSNFRELNREDIWKSNNWQDVEKLLANYDLTLSFEELLNKVTSSLQNPRSKRRIAGIFKSMVSVKSGEVGTEKGANKEKAIAAVDRALLEANLKGQGKRIGLYGGGFKPPHRGHFAVVQELAKQGVDEIHIYIGTAIREGEQITPKQSQEIWKIYCQSKYIPGPKFKIEIANPSPITSVYQEVENNTQGNSYVVITSNKDARRYQPIKDQTKPQYKSAQVVEVDEILEENKISGTDIRASQVALLSGNWLPPLDDGDRLKVLSILKKGFSQDKMQDAIDEIIKRVVAEAVDFKSLEKLLDSMFEDLDIDINFTLHFKERVIERGLTEEDIIDLMDKIHDRYGDQIADLPKDANRVFTHLTKLVDISSAMGSYGPDYLRDLYLTTAFKRKSEKDPEFRTSATSPKLKVTQEQVDEVRGIALGVLPSEVRSRLQNLTAYFERLAPEDVEVEFNGEAIVISLKSYLKDAPVDNTINQPTLDESTGYDYKADLASVTGFMLDKGMKITPLPSIKLRHDPENAKDTLGQTAYYSPEDKEIVLYVTDRHPKDVLRSFCHEMVHHMQNLEGRLPSFTTTNTQEDSALSEIEKEAHFLGSMTLREWEDSCKSNMAEQPLNEGAYDSIVKQLANDILAKWKQDFEENPKRLFSALDTNYELEDSKGRPVEFDLIAKLDFKKTKNQTYTIDGGADEGDDETEGFVSVSFQVDPRTLPQSWEQISFDLRDVLRHEVEHLTQGGWNARQGKEMDDDMAVRDMINKYKTLSPKNYFLLEKEVDAMLQGMYLKAKKQRKPFEEIIDFYLQKQPISGQDIEQIKDLWRKRLPALGIPKQYWF